MSALSMQIDRMRRLVDLGRLEDAASLARSLVQKHPAEPEPLYVLGALLCLAGNASAAIYLRRAVRAAPQRADCRRALAEALAQAGRLAEAISEAEHGLALEPSPDGYVQLGAFQQQARQWPQAAASFRSAIALTSRTHRDDGALHRRATLAVAHNNLANTLVELGQTTAALGEYVASLEIDPRFADAWTNMATSLCGIERYDEAIAAAQQAIAVVGDTFAACFTLANAYSGASRWAEAKQAFDRAIACDSQSVAARYNRSLACMATGDWSGWSDYRLRHVVEPTVRAWSSAPRWRGESLRGRRIVVRREQGIGTQVMFSGYLTSLAEHAAEVFVECDPRLLRLMQRSYPAVRFCRTSELLESPSEGSGPAARAAWRIAAPHFETAIGDLPGLLVDLSASGEHDWHSNVAPPRLIADGLLMRKWRDRLARLRVESRIATGMCVGISWRGGGTAASQRKRSTELGAWRELLGASGVRFVSLQYDENADDASEPMSARLARWSDFNPRSDLEDLAALMVNLDLVISVDNSTIHLAGGLGARTWTLLPAAADWRWMADGDETPWYPSMKLLRATKAGGWGELLAHAAEMMQREAARRLPMAG